MEITVPSYIKEFRVALESGIKSIALSAEIYVQAIDSDPNAKELFAEKFADIVPTSAWAGFEAVGRKHMHPKLLFGAGGNRRQIKSLSYSDQEKIMEGGKLDLLVSGGDTIKVDPREITKEQADQLFGAKCIRTPPEQRAYVESLKTKADVCITKTSVQMPYTIVNHKVYIKSDVAMTKREVKRMLEEM